ncbi:uncharacterized protein A1O5_02913 [Cladophialophora psammophila CBS 110553]|uniref:Ketoreductase (KR) domain-containing protein n=1 Tax=Cladophialophora psammophila CBS 110553 TaxID=1182543 RepID=W9XCF1_9EURO|nr:uncharacterized protein A1O5_02913 [Cladophialophora psammophila CBS 110553]EXJ74616.1 hypothetical protein A1O5_02913 [Cladophialophora psammophila CBS 110553]
MAASIKVVTFDAKADALAVAAYFAPQIKVHPEAFASQSPNVLVLTGRTESKVQECISKMSARYPVVKYIYLQLDLSSLAGARSAAKSLMANAEVPYIDILVNNAELGDGQILPGRI